MAKMHKLLNGDVIDLDTISWIGDVGGFGGGSSSYWTGYSFMTYGSDKKINVEISCGQNKGFNYIFDQVTAESDLIKQHMLSRQSGK